MTNFESTPEKITIRKGRIATSILAIGSLAYGGVVIDALAHQDVMPPAFAGTCDSPTHQALEVGDTSHPGFIPKDQLRFFASDNRTWGEDAAIFSTDRNYYISPARLMADNASLVSYNAKGQAKNTINAAGPVCFNLPGPIVWGQVEQTTPQTELQIADSNAISMKQLWARNTGLPHNESFAPPIGAVIEVGTQTVDGNTIATKPVDTGLVLSRLDGANINSVYHNNPLVRDQIIAANAADLGNGKALVNGSLGYLTLNQNQYMQQNHLTPQMIINAYFQNYKQPMNVEQSVITDPNVVEPVSYSLNDKQIQLINELPLDKKDRNFISKILVAVMSRVNGGDRMNPEAVVAQAILESGFGQSELADYNNVFGVKAGVDWKGQTVVLPTQEQAADGQFYRINSTWRVYNSLGQAVDDYALMIGDGLNPGLVQATKPACRDNPAKYLQALQYLVNANCKIIGEAKPDTAKASYSTDRNYVNSVLRVVNDYNLTAIVDAGQAHIS